jgi:ATP-dependent exoDNAse (exonuclease V) beta subunit
MTVRNLCDDRIILNNENHTYVLSNQPGIKFISVTTFIEKFFEGFDPELVANKLINNYSKYSNFSVSELISKWKAAADHGTKVHTEIEHWIRSGVEPNELKAKNCKEWLRVNFDKSDVIFFPEIIVYSEELSIAGTIDLVTQNKKTGVYDIYDWKTSKKIEMRSYGNKRGTHEVTKKIMDCNFYHYSLQMSLYRYILEKYYDIEINNNHIVHLRDDGVKTISTPYMKNEISAMLNHEKI